MKKCNLLFVVTAFSVFAGLVWGCASDIFQTDTVGYMPPIVQPERY